MTKKCEFTILIIFAFVTSILVVGFFLYLTSDNENKTNIHPINTEIENHSIYRNKSFGFSIKIPDGFFVREQENVFFVVKNPEDEFDTPLPDVTVRVLDGDANTIELTEQTILLNEENIEINGVQGKLFTVSYPLYSEDSECPIYRLGFEERVYEFSLHECLESNIFDDVVESFVIISK